MPSNAASPSKEEVRYYLEDQRRNGKAVESQFSYRYSLLKFSCKHCPYAKEIWEGTRVS